MRKIKPVFVLLLIVIIAFTVSNPAAAHTESQKNALALTYNNRAGHACHGSEDIGWVANPLAHLSGNYSTFSFAASFPAGSKDMVRMGAMGWQSIVYFSESASGMGTITGGFDQNTCTIAFTDVSNHSYTTGHLNSWRIHFNDMYLSECTYTVAMHEFGHVIGLCDLVYDSNINKLMYYADDLTATQVTTMDAWGAKVITGQHSSHNWIYAFYGTNSSGKMHRQYCTSCHAWSSQAAANCTYNANGVCTVCGTHR